MCGSVDIDGREYKLLLDPKGFRGPPEDNVGEAFWEGLKSIIDEELGPKVGGTSRAEGELKAKKPRHVTFFDTEEWLLDGLHFALRRRTDLDDDAEPDGQPEATLKFRSPDVLLAAEYRRIAAFEDTKLEEDIAPLQAARDGKPVALNKPRSLCSRFAVSSKLTDNFKFTKLGQVVERFEWLEPWLATRAGKKYGGIKLREGPTICEWIFEGASASLGNGVKAKFTLTLWYMRKNGSVKAVHERALSGDLDPRIAEISFDFDIEGGQLDAGAAERAARLFIAMQELPVDKKETSKTRLGLPDRK